MVQLMKSRNLVPEPSAGPSRDKVPVKIEIEDSLEEEHGPFYKRSKPFPPFQLLRSDGTNVFPIPPSQYNPLDEPSPLGLRLRKSPSLLDLIQMRLSQGNASALGVAPSGNCNSRDKKDVKGNTSNTDKLKASNFAASVLKIGCWEYASRYEGDLVAKCYFAKHKLVWEVLEGGLKSKIEIQWSDITGLQAKCSDDGPETLKLVLARPPLFFRETNPQPRKHTLWQATADFTDGQASIHRQHFLRCPNGLLNKHFEKLIQCDTRLNFLSQQPEIDLDSPYFEPRAFIFDDLDESKGNDFDQWETDKGSSISGFQDVASRHAAPHSLKIEQQDPICRESEHLLHEAHSPSSVMDGHAIEGNGSCETNDNLKLKVGGVLQQSMSMNDLMSHIGHCISEQMTTTACGNRDMLEDIAQYLLSDSQFVTASDEKSLMSRVNSLCCLLQEDPSTVNNNGENSASDFKDASAMSRKDSFGELLLHIPRIASLPKFLFNISEEDENHASMYK